MKYSGTASISSLENFLEEKATVPQGCSGARTVRCCQREGTGSSRDNHSGGSFDYQKNDGKKEMVNRLRNKFPGMILPERQSAQLVLLHINHAKSGKFKASGEHRKQDKISVFLHNKVIE